MLIIIAISILIGLIFAPLGCLVLWKKYVYFGDGLAHASMLAGIISAMLGVPIFYAGIISTAIFVFGILKFQNNSGNNAAIGLTSSMMIAASLVLSSLYSNQINITKYLVGDIISASWIDLWVLILIFLVVLLFFVFFYKDLVLTSLSKDVAGVLGIKVKLLEIAFLVILSFAILSTIKIVGALMVISIIIIPSMTARLIAKSPLNMILLAVFFGLIMNCFGIVISFYADIAFAPVIILYGGVIYFLASIANFYKS